MFTTDRVRLSLLFGPGNDCLCYQWSRAGHRQCYWCCYRFHGNHGRQLFHPRFDEWDVIGNAVVGATLTVSGGSFIGTNAGTNVGLNAESGKSWTSTLKVSGAGSATVATLTMNANTATVNLDGGTLTANNITRPAGTANFNFNGGTLKAGTGAVTDFMTTAASAGSFNVYVKSDGAKIDTNGKTITIGQNLLDFTTPSGGGLTLNDTAVTKGTLTLSGTGNTYTGATTVTNGKLVVNGSISTSSLTTVDAAGTLAGIGTVGAATINGDLAPGDGGIESLNFGGNLTLAGTSTFEISAANTADLAISSALLAFGGVLNVSNIAGTLANGQSFDLFNWGTTTGAFSAVNLPTLDSGLTWDQSSLYTNGTITVVPEPRAALLGGLGMLALLRRRRH